jgi:hypothetical protein
MSVPIERKVIIVAGISRSGSTWLYNAARLLLTAAGQTPYAAWIRDLDPQDETPVRLIKAHTPAEVTFLFDIVLTTHRPFEDCLASLVRIGWLKPEAEAIRKRYAVQKSLYDYWAAKSALELPYAQIIGEPETALARLAAALDLPADPARDHEVAAQLAAMQAPEGGSYDPKTLLHPRHRAATEHDTAGIVEMIREALAQWPSQT